MRKLDNTERLALMQIANFDCIKSVDECTTCPYYAHIESYNEDFEDCCISYYLKQILDKYYTEKR